MPKREEAYFMGTNNNPYVSYRQICFSMLRHIGTLYISCPILNCLDYALQNEDLFETTPFKILNPVPHKNNNTRLICIVQDKYNF